MDQNLKVRENRLRRAASRQGFRLAKVRRFDPLAVDYGRYRIECTDDGTEAALSVDGHGLTLDDAEWWLLHPESRP